MPYYPAEAWQAAIEDTVSVRLTVGTRGRIVGVDFIDGGSDEFKESTMAALEHWVFFPAQGTDGPVPATVVVRFGYNMEDARHSRVRL